MNIKALILAGGRGKRLNHISSETNKCMMLFNDKPLIVYSLDNAVSAGVEEIVIVVGYLAEDIINNIGILHKGVPIKYVIQYEQKGLVHAIECAKEAIGKCDFMTFLGDEVLLNPLHKEMVELYVSSNVFSICGVTRAKDKEDVSKTYAIIEGEGSRIYRLIEKPGNPLNNIMGTGNCIFNNKIFDYISQTPINQKRGEKELPDMIQCAIDDGREVISYNIGSGYININTEDDVLQAERYLNEI